MRSQVLSPADTDTQRRPFILLMVVIVVLLVFFIGVSVDAFLVTLRYQQLVLMVEDIADGAVDQIQNGTSFDLVEIKTHSMFDEFDTPIQSIDMIYCGAVTETFCDKFAPRVRVSIVATIDTVFLGIVGIPQLQLLVEASSQRRYFDNP